MTRLLSRITLALLCAFTVYPSLSRAEETAEISLGSILILTGQGASWGNATKNGIDLAIEDINAAGGVLGKKLKINHQDDQGDPKKSLAAFQQLTTLDGAKLIIGPNWSTLGLPLVEPASRVGVLIISPSLGMAKFNESHELLFNTWPHDELLSRRLAEHVYAKGRRKVALVGAEEIWVKEQTNAFRKQFEALGGTIGLLFEPLPTTTDLRMEATRIKGAAGIDAVVSTTDGVLVGSYVAKSLRELHAQLPMYSITVDQQAIDAAQGGFEGMEFLTFLTPSPEFQKRYEERYHTTIDIGADSGYDAVRMLADAITRAQSAEPRDVARELAVVKSYDGVSGTLLTDGKRGFTKPYLTRRVVSGKPTTVSTEGAR